MTACSAHGAAPESGRAHTDAGHTGLAAPHAAPAPLQHMDSRGEQPPTPLSAQPNSVIRMRSEDFAIECALSFQMQHTAFACLQQKGFEQHTASVLAPVSSCPE